MDSKIVQVALNGLENILRLGEQDAKMHVGTNPYAVMIEECYGTEIIYIIHLYYRSAVVSRRWAKAPACHS